MSRWHYEPSGLPWTLVLTLSIIITTWKTSRKTRETKTKTKTKKDKVSSHNLKDEEEDERDGAEAENLESATDYLTHKERYLN